MIKINNEIIGYIGVFFISINLVPQLYYIYQKKDASSISSVSVMLGILSGIIMTIYGCLIHKIPIIISNCIIIFFYTCILILKKIYELNNNCNNCNNCNSCNNINNV
jgi:uncharacterized protein with PQ loop repeat